MLGVVQYAPNSSAMQFSSVNLITQSKPCFHIARFLPSIKDCQAPFTFAWQVRISLAAADLRSQISFQLRSSFAAGDGAGQAELLPHLGLVSAL